MQGVIKAYDPITADGVIISDADLREFDLAPGAHKAFEVARRPTADNADRPGVGVLAEQRALRPPDDLDALDDEQRVL